MVRLEDSEYLMDIPGLIQIWEKPYDLCREQISHREIGMMFIKDWKGDRCCVHYIHMSSQPERLNPEDASNSVCDSLNFMET